MRRSVVIFLTLAMIVLGLVAPAAADHTEPREPIASAETVPAPESVVTGEGTWEYLFGLPPNPGTDLEIFKLKKRLFMSAGTLGGAAEQHVGQRFVRLLLERGRVAPKWIADHGSAACVTNSRVATSLQHDASVARRNGVTLVVDATDNAAGPQARCHDPENGGGLELIDVSKLNRAKFMPREIHLTRHQGTSHNATVDATRPWIIYNSSSEFNVTAQAQIDVLDIRSCLIAGQTLEQRRKSCRPKVFRMQFSPGWTANVDESGEPIEGYDSSCHDIIARPGRIYCAGLSGTAIFDVRNIADPKTGAVRGKPLKCEVVDGTATTAKVTDCLNILTPGEGESIPQATGWRYLGTARHPGRNCGAGPTGPNNCNNNVVVPSREGVAVSHEAVPTADNKYMFVTDERGGGIVPGGASCAPEEENPYGNGGVHMYDISDPSSIKYVMTPDDLKAVFIGSVQVPQTTFCTAHRMELVPGEQRFFISWYSQGTKVVDYFFDANGKVVFRETASFVPQGTNQWAVQPFKIVRNDDGTKTYYLAASDIARGIDVFSWTGPPNPKGSAPPAELMPAKASERGTMSGVPLAVLILMLIPMLRSWRSRRVV